MGKLVEQSIKTLFNGVSRQPHPVRLPSQIEAGDNILLSVVTGGFEKRPATRHIKKLTTLDAAEEYAMHIINRDSTHQYAVVVGDSDLRVFDLADGTEKTVSFPDGKAYLDDSPHDYVFATIADYTFVANKTVTVALATATSGSISGTVQTFSDLGAASAHSGEIWRVRGNATDGFSTYFVKSDGTTWKEWVDPNGQNDFDTSTMPWQLVESGGSFTFQKGAWSSRACGDSTVVPAPAFVGKTISDVFLYRGRLGILADESGRLSQAGDVFNFWPEKAFQQLDSDPVEFTSQSNQVTLLRNATPFRKTLFVGSDTQQFELSAAERLTQKTAAFDATTAYQADPMTDPVTMGDQLYFVGVDQSSGVVYEYYYNGDTFSNTAGDVTKHCLGYLPSSIRKVTASSLAGRLFLLPDGARNHLYTYTSYWKGQEKAQSAWSRYVFGEDEDAAYVYGVEVVNDLVYMLIARNGQVCLEKFAANTEADDEDLGFAVLYDRRTSVVGTYDAVNNWTTWTTPYDHSDDVQVLLGSGHTGKAGKILNVTYPSSTTVRATGDYGTYAAYLGIEYEKRAELSKQYLRDESGTAIQSGRLQLRTLAVNYKDTGYFEIHVTPDTRDTKVWKMTGRTLGSIYNLLGAPVIVPQGQRKVKINSRADTVKIEIVNSSPYPSVITSALWVGFYNNVVRQG